jgi:bifunctional non-homologous end joining protein LigD
MEHPLRPMEPERWPEAFDDPGWQFEVKWDGVRCIAVCSKEGVRFYGRRGSDWTGRFPEIEEELRRRSGVFDGELVVLEQGRPSFPAMLRRLRRVRGPVHYMVFDRLEDEDGRDLRPLALPLRQAALPEFSGRVRRVPSVREHGRALFRAADEAGLEGVVAKRIDAPYVPGKSPFWRKVKCWRTLVCTVHSVDVERGDVRSVRLSLPGTGPIGSVGGLSRTQGQELLAAQAEGGDILCKVAYIEWTPEGQLRHPRWQGLIRPG